MTVGSFFSLIGGPLWGYVSDKIIKRRAPFIRMGLLGASIPFYIIAIFGNQIGITPLVILFSIFGFVSNGILLGYTLINEMVDESQSGFFSAFINMGPYIGSSIFLVISGRLLGDPSKYLADGTPFYPFGTHSAHFQWKD